MGNLELNLTTFETCLLSDYDSGIYMGDVIKKEFDGFKLNIPIEECYFLEFEGPIEDYKLYGVVVVEEENEILTYILNVDDYEKRLINVLYKSVTDNIQLFIEVCANSQESIFDSLKECSAKLLKLGAHKYASHINDIIRQLNNIK